MSDVKKFVVCVLFFLFLSGTAPVHAGMPSSLRLSQYVTQYTSERMISLSTGVFLGLVVSTLILRLCWGVLVRETDWPKPTLLKSFAATLLGGVLFFLVIVMIAGSRELFSSGAWKSDGVLYKLASSPQTRDNDTASAFDEINTARLMGLEKLRDHLKSGTLPTSNELFGTSSFSSKNTDLWIIPFASGMRYEYHQNEDDGRWLVVEPAALEYQTPSVPRRGIERDTFQIVEISTADEKEVMQ